MRQKIKKYFSRYYSECPKTGKIKFKIPHRMTKLLFPLIGLMSLLWFLTRIIPKPSRASYPCMKVAAPVASGFVVYLLGLLTSVFAFHKAKKYFQQSRYTIAVFFILFALVGAVWMTGSSDKPTYAYINKTAVEQPVNQPVGEAKGIFPGRVVWVYDPEATNENCTNKWGDAWFLPKNNNQDVIDKMFTDALLAMTGEKTEAEAWNAAFKFFNKNHEKGDVGFEEGEIIYIKINATSTWGGNYDTNNFSVKNNKNYGISETNPHLVLAILRQLVNVVGVPQEDIYIGDPMKHIYKHSYDLWSAEFPDVHYLDHSSNRVGREIAVKSSKKVIQYSDKGQVLREGDWNDATKGAPITDDALYSIYHNADYMINIPTLKGHKHAGITMFAKNHFGSHTRNDAKHLHNGLVAPEQDNPRRTGYGLYRVTVDLMGHEMLGGNTLFFLMDALYPSDYEIDKPDKFLMAPFNNDWMSSLFISQDMVAIESVGYDFLYTEFTEESVKSRGLEAYPQMEGTDDYLHQAADEKNWPEGIVYDPEGDGTKLTSLGVHEHWNNPVDKQYTRNLGVGDGIELYTIDNTQTSVEKENLQVAGDFDLFQNYPNPFNPSTNIQYELKSDTRIELSIFNTLGQKIRTLVNGHQLTGSYTVSWNGLLDTGAPAPSGVYIYQLIVESDKGYFTMSKEMLLLK